MKKLSVVAPSPNEEAQIVKQESHQKKIFRLIQVRQQEKETSTIMRQKMKNTKDKKLKMLISHLKDEFEQAQINEEKFLMNQLTNRMKKIGGGHDVRGKENYGAKRKMTDQMHGNVLNRYRNAMTKVLQDRTNKENILASQQALRDKIQQDEEERKRYILSQPRKDRDRIADLKPVKVVASSNKNNSLESFSMTRFHMYAQASKHPHEADDIFIEKPNSGEQVDAKVAAEDEALKLKLFDEKTQQELNEQKEKAELRFRYARQQVLLKQQQDALIEELEGLTLKDRNRRKQVVSDLPKHLFQPEYQRREDIDKKQHELEHIFEKVYNMRSEDPMKRYYDNAKEILPTTKLDSDLSTVPEEEEEERETDDRACRLQGKDEGEIAATLASAPPRPYDGDSESKSYNEDIKDKFLNEVNERKSDGATKSKGTSHQFVTDDNHVNEKAQSKLARLRDKIKTQKNVAGRHSRDATTSIGSLQSMNIESACESDQTQTRMGDKHAEGQIGDSRPLEEMGQIGKYGTVTRTLEHQKRIHDIQKRHLFNQKISQQLLEASNQINVRLPQVDLQSTLGSDTTNTTSQVDSSKNESCNVTALSEQSSNDQVTQPIKNTTESLAQEGENYADQVVKKEEKTQTDFKDIEAATQTSFASHSFSSQNLSDESCRNESVTSQNVSDSLLNNVNTRVEQEIINERLPGQPHIVPQAINDTRKINSLLNYELNVFRNHKQHMKMQREKFEEERRKRKEKQHSFTSPLMGNSKESKNDTSPVNISGYIESLETQVNAEGQNAYKTKLNLPSLRDLDITSSSQGTYQRKQKQDQVDFRILERSSESNGDISSVFQELDELIANMPKNETFKRTRGPVQPAQGRGYVSQSGGQPLMRPDKFNERDMRSPPLSTVETNFNRETSSRLSFRMESDRQTNLISDKTNNQMSDFSMNQINLKQSNLFHDEVSQKTGNYQQIGLSTLDSLNDSDQLFAELPAFLNSLRVSSQDTETPSEHQSRFYRVAELPQVSPIKEMDEQEVTPSLEEQSLSGASHQEYVGTRLRSSSEEGLSVVTFSPKSNVEQSEQNLSSDREERILHILRKYYDENDINLGNSNEDGVISGMRHFQIINQVGDQQRDKDYVSIEKPPLSVLNNSSFKFYEMKHENQSPMNIQQNQASLVSRYPQHGSLEAQPSLSSQITVHRKTASLAKRESVDSIPPAGFSMTYSDISFRPLQEVQGSPSLHAAEVSSQNVTSSLTKLSSSQSTKTEPSSTSTAYQELLERVKQLPLKHSQEQEDLINSFAKMKADILLNSSSSSLSSSSSTLKLLEEATQSIHHRNLEEDHKLSYGNQIAYQSHSILGYQSQYEPSLSSSDVTLHSTISKVLQDHNGNVSSHSVNYTASEALPQSSGTILNFSPQNSAISVLGKIEHDYHRNETTSTSQSLDQKYRKPFTMSYFEDFQPEISLRQQTDSCSSAKLSGIDLTQASFFRLPQAKQRSPSSSDIVSADVIKNKDPVNDLENVIQTQRKLESSGTVDLHSPVTPQNFSEYLKNSEVPQNNSTKSSRNENIEKIPNDMNSLETPMPPDNTLAVSNTPVTPQDISSHSNSISELTEMQILHAGSSSDTVFVTPEVSSLLTTSCSEKNTLDLINHVSNDSTSDSSSSKLFTVGRLSLNAGKIDLDGSRQASTELSLLSDLDLSSMPESDVNWSTLIPLKSETTSSSEKSNEKKNLNDAVSLQEAFLKKNQDFIAKSKLRVQKVKDVADINVHKKKTTSKKLSERKPAVKKKNVAIKLDKDNRKESKAEMQQRTKSLYMQLEEVQKQKQEQDKIKDGVRNRERAREFHQKLQRNMRRRQQERR